MQRALVEHLFLCGHFQTSICNVVFGKESSTTYFSLCFSNFCWSYLKALSWKNLWRSLLVFYDVEPCILMIKWFHQRQFVQIFRDKIIFNASLQWVPILIVLKNISINKLVYRRYPLVHCDKYWVRNTYLRSSILLESILQTKISVLWKLSLSLKRFPKIVRKSVYFGISLLRNFRSLIYKM